MSSREHRVGLTLIEIAVVIAILAVLIVPLLPAAQSAREAGWRSRSRDRLKPIGLVMHSCERANNCLPSAAGADSVPDGGPPDLTTLDESGDLVHTVDFRSVHAAVLGGWFGADSRKVLEGSFEPAKILKQPGASA
jgi:type II secretory pathway pseudopilin PulG